MKRDDNRGERPARSGEGRPFRKDGEGKSFKKPFSRDGQKPSGERNAFRKDGGSRSEGHAGRSKKRAY